MNKGWGENGVREVQPLADGGPALGEGIPDFKGPVRSNKRSLGLLFLIKSSVFSHFKDTENDKNEMNE